MAATTPLSPTSNDLLANFRQSLRKYTRKAICGREYVLIDKFKRKHLEEADIKRLLASIYRYQPNSPIEAKTIFKHSRIVLSILIETQLNDLAWLLEFFVRYSIDDGKLPYNNEAELVRIIRDEGETEEVAVRVARDFCQTQWKYLAHKFGERETVDIDARVILPIVDRKEIKSGGTAQLWEIVVLEDFVSENLREDVKRSAFTPTPRLKDDDGKRYTFALKSFPATTIGAEAYRDEKTAFHGVRGQKGIVRCLGCYSHGEHFQQTSNGHLKGTPAIRKTYHILLEFGDMDLEEYFYGYDPPVLQDEIGKFWKLLFAVVTALKGIHNFEKQSEDGKQIFNGWHADIKPANILFIHKVFKLADLGFAILVQKKAGNEPFRNELKGGTWSYGAPETLEPQYRKAVTQAIDIWSLGCVFSEAASWMIGSSTAVKAFTAIRKSAVSRANLSQIHIDELNAGDCFHDGKNVLKDVLDWHNVLRQSMRKNDNITGQVLDLVERKMLVADPLKRISVRELSEELDLILKTPMEGDGYTVPENIMSALLAADQNASSDAYLSTEKQPRSLLGSSLNRKEKKSRRVNITLRPTAQRSDVLKSALHNSSKSRNGRTSPDDAIQDPSIQITSIRVPTMPSPLVNIPETDEHHVPPELLSPSSPFITQIPLTQSPPADSRHSRQWSLPPTAQVSYPPQTADVSDRYDVFQARKDLEIEEKNKNPLKKWRSMRGKHAKNERLSRHFQDRDIIFLVDNATSMIPYWAKAEYVLTTLVWMCVGQDKDGMELRFTSGGEYLRNSQDRLEFAEYMNRPAAKPSNSTETDITDSLGRIFQKYIKSLNSSRQKALTIIVLTDGRWDGMTNKGSIKGRIAEFVRQVIRGSMNHLNRPVSIEFIQFGDDQDAKRRLEELDDGLHDSMGIPDVVDHESADGDVYKMILGSFVHSEDRRDQTRSQMRSREGTLSRQQSEMPAELAGVY